LLLPPLEDGLGEGEDDLGTGEDCLGGGEDGLLDEKPPLLLPLSLLLDLKLERELFLSVF